MNRPDFSQQRLLIRGSRQRPRVFMPIYANVFGIGKGSGLISFLGQVQMKVFLLVFSHVFPICLFTGPATCRIMPHGSEH